MNNNLYYILIGLALGLWIGALYRIATARFRGDQNRIIWFLLIVCFPILGPIIFFQARKRITKGARKFRLKVLRSR